MIKGLLRRKLLAMTVNTIKIPYLKWESDEFNND